MRVWHTHTHNTDQTYGGTRRGIHLRTAPLQQLHYYEEGCLLESISAAAATASVAAAAAAEMSTHRASSAHHPNSRSAKTGFGLHAVTWRAYY